MKERYTLDSFAVLTYLKEEPGWQKVRNILWEGYQKKLVLFLNSVNLGEIYYIVYRENGAALADKIASIIKSWPVKIISAGTGLSLIAGRMKAENKISYADAFVIATALTNRTSILTGDKEFKSIEPYLNICWLPKNR